MADGGHKEKKGNWGSLGGNNAMHSFDPVGTQTPDRTSQEGSGGSKTSIKPMAGPSSVMGYSESGNQSFAGTQTPGQSSSCPSGGDKNGFAKGGKTSMFGNRGSIPARGGFSSP